MKLWNSTIDSIYKKFAQKLKSIGFKPLDCGSYRMVWQRKGIVIKIPLNESGILDNMVESAVWHLYKSKPTPQGYYLAPSRLLKNNCLMMVSVDVDSDDDLPAWAYTIDACQVGIYKNRFVAYDYALDVEVPDDLAQEYFGLF